MPDGTRADENVNGAYLPSSRAAASFTGFIDPTATSA